MFWIYLFSTPELRSFLIDHGIDPVAPRPERLWNATTVYEESVLGTDPFEARFTFTVDGDALTLTVDDDLNVVDVVERDPAGTD